MRRAVTSAALAVAATTAAAAVVGLPGPAEAVTGSYDKDFAHAYVAMLVFHTTPDEDGDTFSHRCTGSLLADRVTVVTAGHCTEGVDEGRAYFQQAAAPAYSPDAFGGFGGDETTGYPYRGGVTFSRADNYGFDDFEGYPENKDVGVVVLDEPVRTSNARYAELPEVGALEEYVAAARSKKEVRFTPVGYGVNRTTPTPSPLSTRERLRTTSYLVEDRAPVTRFNLKTTANPAQGKGGTCSGDSGGPMLAQGTDTVVAVTSFGQNSRCRGLDFSYRLDRPAVLRWILDPERVDAG